jgi:hypothetical protein
VHTPTRHLGAALRVLALATALFLSSLVIAVPANAAAKDTDKDGLPDSWEKKGAKVPGGLDIYRLGARYNHKDVFVELNYTSATYARKVSCAGLDALYSAFAKAPVTNKDSKKGVRLHLDAGKKCASRTYDLKGSGKISASKASAADGYIHPTTYGLASNRKRVFRNGIVAEDSRLAQAEGEALDDFVVKRRGGGSAWTFVTLHELGHTFGLDHGPARAISVMSGGATYYGDQARPFADFSRYPTLPLDENNLDEHSGYATGSTAGDAYLGLFLGKQYCPGGGYAGRATGPIDWDCSGAPFWMPPYDQWISATPVAADIDNSQSMTVLPEVLAEWPYVLTHLGHGRIG